MSIIWRRPATAVVFGLVVLGIAMASATPGRAAGLSQGGGTFDLSISGDTVLVQTVGTNVLVHSVNGGGHIDGTFVGTWLVDEWDVVHASGSISVRGWNTMDVTFNGEASGTVLIRYEGKANANTGDFHGYFVIVSGTGDLATLWGQGTVWVENGIGGYAFQYQFQS